MRVDVWSDLVCPWCAIGQAHLQTALAGFEHADEVEVVWRSFELDPGAPAVRDDAYDALLAAEYGASLAGGRAMVVRLSSAAERAGVQARFDLARPANTSYAVDVRADEAEAGRREITAVPTFLLDGRNVVPGAQSADSLLATLRSLRGRT